MTQQRIIIPVDHGNRNLKTENYVFTSGVMEHRRELKQLIQAKYWHENPDSDRFCAVLKVINNDAFSRF